MAKTEKAQKMKADVAKKKQALATLQSLNGKTYIGMSKTEQEAVITAVLKLLNITDADDKINV